MPFGPLRSFVVASFHSYSSFADKHLTFEFSMDRDIPSFHLQQAKVYNRPIFFNWVEYFLLVWRRSCFWHIDKNAEWGNNIFVAACPRQPVAPCLKTWQQHREAITKIFFVSCHHPPLIPYPYPYPYELGQELFTQPCATF